MPEPFECEALQDNLAGSGKGSEKNALAAEDGCADATYHLYVVFDGGFESNQMAGLNLELLARREVKFDEIAARVDEHGAGTC